MDRCKSDAIAPYYHPSIFDLDMMFACSIKTSRRKRSPLLSNQRCRAIAVSFGNALIVFHYFSGDFSWP